MATANPPKDEYSPPDPDVEHTLEECDAALSRRLDAKVADAWLDARLEVMEHDLGSRS